MGRVTVTIEDELIEAAKAALGEKSGAGAIRAALEEVVRRCRLENVLEHRGNIDLDVDQTELRRLRAVE